VGVDGFAQRAGALAVHDADAADATLPALGEIIIQQGRDLVRAESMQIQFTGDRDGDRFLRRLVGHAAILAAVGTGATKNPPLAGRVI